MRKIGFTFWLLSLIAVFYPAINVAMEKDSRQRGLNLMAALDQVERQYPSDRQYTSLVGKSISATEERDKETKIYSHVVAALFFISGVIFFAVPGKKQA
jgi:hypothetical protein